MQQHTLNGSRLNTAAYKWLILVIWSKSNYATKSPVFKDNGMKDDLSLNWCQEEGKGGMEDWSQTTDSKVD